ncbi:MAG TPA: alpha/beta hydrolase [Patescibacteria group bacterium]|nr:alpha/beta hydrolase [Patescibacteria group bacterium]
MRIFAAILFVCLFGQAAWADETLVQIPSRPGVTVPVLLLTPPPAATPPIAVILLVGSSGNAGLEGYAPGYRSQNFLFRSADLFAGKGLLTAVVDVPSDRGDLWNFRATADHATDIAAVIAALRARGAASVWLVGTSMGSVSAAHVAGRLTQGGPDGVVLTSSVVLSSKKSIETVMTADLEAITVPVLVVGHRSDACKFSSPSMISSILRELSHAPIKAELLMEGGDAPRSEACEALAAHGYIGVEEATVTAIAAWIHGPKAAP